LFLYTGHQPSQTFVQRAKAALKARILREA